MQSFEVLVAGDDPFALMEYHVLGENIIGKEGCPDNHFQCNQACQQEGFKKGTCEGFAGDECNCHN